MPDEYRRVDGELKLLQQENDFIFPVELWMVNDSVNRNNWQFVNLEEHRTLWAGVPILVAYVNGGKTVGSGHNQTTRRDDMGNEYQSFTDATAERIVGAISENPADIRLAERDGYTWVVGKGFLWAWYARELVDKITNDARQGRTMSVSIEALVTQESIGDNGVAVEEEYTPLGVTVLGDKVDPAVVDAHIAMLSDLGDEFKELKLRAASYIGETAEPVTDCAETKPQNNTEKKGMRNAMNLSKQQLRELAGKFGEYDVKAGVQTDSGFVIALASKTGETAVYRMSSLDEKVYLEKIEKVNATVHFCADGCDDLSLDACDMYEDMIANVKTAEKRAESAEKKCAEANDTMNAMRDAEYKRRVQAAKDKAAATLEAFNRNREDKVDEKVLSAVTNDIESGVYTLCTNKDGDWDGDKRVEREVKALCADVVMELDKTAAEKRMAANKNTFVWEKLASGAAADDGSVEALLARKGITG